MVALNTLTVQETRFVYSTQGVDDVRSKADALAKAQTGVAKSSESAASSNDKVEKSARGTADAYGRAGASAAEAAQKQLVLERAQRQIQASMMQAAAGSDAYSNSLAGIAEAQMRLAQATTQASAQMVKAANDNAQAAKESGSILLSVAKLALEHPFYTATGVAVATAALGRLAGTAATSLATASAATAEYAAGSLAAGSAVQKMGFVAAEGLMLASRSAGVAGTAFSDLSSRAAGVASVFSPTGGMISAMVRGFAALPGALLASAAALATVGVVAVAGAFALSKARDDLTKLVETAERAEKLDLGATLVKSFSDIGPAIRVSGEQIQAALTKASAFLQERLGQPNQLVKALADLESGGFTGGAPLLATKLAEAARTTEERLRAALAAMSELQGRGQQLAALDLADKVLGPAFVERLRTGQVTVSQIISELDRAQQKQLFSDADARRALELARAIEDTKRRIAEATESAFDFSKAAMVLDGVWLSILQTVLKVVEASNKAAGDVANATITRKYDQSRVIDTSADRMQGDLDYLKSTGDAFAAEQLRGDIEKTRAAARGLREDFDAVTASRIDSFIGQVEQPTRILTVQIEELAKASQDVAGILPDVAGKLNLVGNAAGQAAAQVATVAAGIRAIQNLNPELSGALGYIDKLAQVEGAYRGTQSRAREDLAKGGDSVAYERQMNDALTQRERALKAINDQQMKGANDYVRSGDLSKMSDVDRGLSQNADSYARVRKELEATIEVRARAASSPEDEARIRRQGDAELAKIDGARKLLDAKTRTDAAAKAASKAADTSAGDDAYDNALKRSRDQVQEFELQARSADKASEEVFKLTEANRLRRAAASAGRADEAGIADAIDAQAVAYARARKASEDAIEAQRRLQEGQREIASEFGRFAEDILLGGAKMGEAFASLAKTMGSGTLRALLIGEGPLAGLLGTAPKDKGDVGGLLGGQINLGSLFKVDDIARTLGLGAETGIGNALSAALKPSKAGGGFLSSPLGGGLAAGAAGASVGYSSASPLMGAGTGIIAGLATGNPVAAVAGGVLGFIGGLFGKSAEQEAARKRIQQQLQQYVQEYANMLPQIAQLRAGLRGEATTGVEQTIETTRGQMVQANIAASKAGQQSQADDMVTEFYTYRDRLHAQFVETFEGTLKEIGQGLGPSGPFNQAAVQVRQLGESLMAFVADTKTIAGAEATARARAAAVEAALGTLDAPKTLSATATEFARIQGTAAGLQTVLVQLGASAEDAAKAISTRTAAALDALRDKFNDDVGRKLNDAQDRGYLNDAADLIKEVKTLREDAATVGGDLGQVQAYFTAAAQKIVNGSELTGTAFDDLMKRFPDLTGLVHAYDAALVDTTKSAADAAAAEEALAARRLGYQDRAFAATNDSSTLSGSLAAFDRKAAQDRAAEVKAGGQAINDLETALAAERLGIIQDFAIKAAEAAQAAADAIAGRVRGYADRLFAATNDTSTLEGQLVAYDRQAQQERQDEVKAGGEAIAELEAAQFAERLKIVVDYQTQAAAAEKQRMDAAQTAFDTFARNIKSFLDGLRAGSSSPLSPQARLAAAQSQYNAQIALAQGGNRDALDGITGYASDLLDAAKGFYASSSAFQTIFGQVQQQLGALPTQVSAEQFIVNAITDSKTATVAATQAMQAVLKTAIDSGSGAATAAALLPQFSNLTATTGGLLNYNQFVQATGGLATVSEQQAARTIFNSIDADGSGQISKLELINAQTASTSAYASATAGWAQNTSNQVAAGNGTLGSINGQTSATKDQVAAGNTVLNGINSQTSATRENVGAGNGVLLGINAQTSATKDQVGSSNAYLNAINSLSNTQIAQLNALNNQFAFSPFNAPNGVRLDNNLVTALNKIVFNTANTVIGQKAGAAYIFASGGLVSGPGTGTSDSISARLSNGEFVMTAEATRRLGVDRLNALNDNLMSAMPSVAMPFPVAMPMAGGTDSASAAEIRALRAELKAALDTLARATVAGAEHVGERVDGVKDAVDEGRRSDLLAA